MGSVRIFIVSERSALFISPSFFHLGQFLERALGEIKAEVLYGFPTSGEMQH